MKGDNSARRQHKGDGSFNQDANKNNNSLAPKVIDCFLFFQELDLLEIRMRYLKDIVDTFVIVEACQTFTGKSKEFLFEINQDRYEEYKGKIKYFKVEDRHTSYESVLDYLSRAPKSKATSWAKRCMEAHQHYDKTKLYYVLDTYHRECIHMALEEICAKDIDTVMISDLDEIPSLHAIHEAQNLNSEKPLVLKQKEFSYFLDYYKNSNWLGTVIGKYGKIRDCSLNELRIDSKLTRAVVNCTPLETGGYHFTTCGSIQEIKQKISSWAHQEFNNRYVTDTLEEKIKTGQDPFSRNSGTIFKRVSIDDESFYDKEMKHVIKDFPNLLSSSEIEVVKSSILGDLLSKIRLYLPRLTDKVKTLICSIKVGIRL